MSIAITTPTPNPILAALQDLSDSDSSATDTSAPGVLGSSGASGSATDAVAIGQNGGLDLSSVDSLALGLNRATSIANMALGAGQSVAGLLSSLKAQATAAEDPSLDPSQRQALDGDFKSVLGQIATTVSQAGFDGVNLLDGASSAGLKLSASADGGGALTLSAQNLTLGGPVVTVAATASLGTASAAASALSDITDSLTNLQTALSALSDQASQIGAHGAIVNRLSGALQAGTPANASDDVDSARLLALQVQQQLSAQSQPIANQAPQLVLSLFR